jgi:hypothetical protein
MKKTYISPKFLAVELNSGRICDTLIIGSGNTAATRGNGTDLVKEENTYITDKSLWDEEW